MLFFHVPQDVAAEEHIRTVYRLHVIVDQHPTALTHYITFVLIKGTARHSVDSLDGGYRALSASHVSFGKIHATGELTSVNAGGPDERIGGDRLITDDYLALFGTGNHRIEHKLGTHSLNALFRLHLRFSRKDRQN